MIALDRLRRIFERILEIWVVFLVSALTVIVVLAVIWRKAGASFVWYDEVGTIMLAWITYYGAALAALKRAHIGFDGILLAMPYHWRIAVAILGEIVVFAFFIVLAWSGMMVLEVLQGMRLISLPDVPVRFTQSVIPIGATLFVICEALSLPEYWRRLREGISAEVAEVTEQMHAQEESSDVTLFVMLIGLVVLVFANVPIAVALGAIAAVAIVADPGHLHAAQRRAHDVRGRAELSAPRHSDVHPGGGDHELLVDLASVDGFRHCAGRLHPRRPRACEHQSSRCSSPRSRARPSPTSPPQARSSCPP